ncbi:MAG: translation initiation factor IF-3, partial [Pseudomonadota bacterium]
MPPKDDGPRINEAITNAKVLLIDAEGEKRGVMKIEDALDLAADA